MLANEAGVRYLSVFIGISTTRAHIPVWSGPASHSVLCIFPTCLYVSSCFLYIPSSCLLTVSFPTSVENALILSLTAVAMAAASGGAS